MEPVFFLAITFLWFGLLFLSYQKKNMPLKAITAVIGMMFGVDIVNNVSLVIGCGIIFLNLYVLYEAIFKEGIK